MILWEPQYRLEMVRYRGELRAVGRNGALRLLVDKADRQDELWAMADRWLGGPVRWLAGLARRINWNRRMR
jgi:hypothetical protein